MTMNSSPVTRLIVLGLAVSLVACTSPITDVAPGNRAARAISKTGGSSQAYTIAPGDRLRVTVFGDAGMTGEYSVDEGGAVAIPLAGNVKVAGRSAAQAGTAIAGALKSAQALRDPRVTVEVMTLRPFYILGEVTRPGEYPYRPGLSLFAAVATAGGYTYRADKGQVYIRKANERTERLYDLNSDIAIMPGDVIRIPESYF